MRNKIIVIFFFFLGRYITGPIYNVPNRQRTTRRTFLLNGARGDTVFYFFLLRFFSIFHLSSFRTNTPGVNTRIYGVVNDNRNHIGAAVVSR